MTRWMLGVAALVLSANTWAVDFEHIDLYDDVRQSPESGDCSGFSIELWRAHDSTAASNVAGLFTFYDGPCERPPRPLFDARLDAKSGRLTFAAPTGDGEMSVTFSGVIAKGRLTGTLWLRPTGPGDRELQPIEIDLPVMRGHRPGWRFSPKS